jgi:CheY-like chemotaxis protein
MDAPTILLDALNHFQDLGYLRGHGVCQFLPPKVQQGSGKDIQSALAAGIDQIKPFGGSDIDQASEPGRLHSILHHRFVQGLTVQDVANRMGMSPRHLKREQRRAIIALLAVLHHDQETDAAQAGAKVMDSPARAPLGLEVALLQNRDQRVPVSLASLIHEVLALLDHPLQTQKMTVRWESPTDLPAIQTYPALLRQALISAFGCFLDPSQRVCPAGEMLSVQATAAAGQTVQLALTGSRHVSVEDGVFPPSPQQRQVLFDLLASLGGNAEYVTEPPLRRIILTLPAMQPVPILVIEDNPDTVRLYQRYLEGEVYQLHILPPDQSVVEAILALNPAVVLLDLMMPGHDGWEWLVDIRHNPATADVPVIVCSVLADDGLARSLGATAYRQKPVSRQTLLALLNELAGPRVAVENTVENT